MTLSISSGKSVYFIDFDSFNLGNGIKATCPNPIEIENKTDSDVLILSSICNIAHVPSEVINVTEPLFIKRGSAAYFSPTFYKNEKIPFGKQIPALKAAIMVLELKDVSQHKKEIETSAKNQEIKSVTWEHNVKDSEESVNIFESADKESIYNEEYLNSLSDGELEDLFNKYGFSPTKNIKYKKTKIEHFIRFLTKD